MSESNSFLSRRLNPTESSVCLENFKHYLRFKGCGIPRRVIRSFNELVAWQNGSPVLRFRNETLRRITFYTQLNRCLERNLACLLGSLSGDAAGTRQDRFKLGVYYVLDWILVRGTGEFTTADVLIHRQPHAYEVARNAMTALTTLNTDDAFPVVAKIIGGFTHGDGYISIVSPFVPQHVSGICALLRSPDIIVRLGTLRLLHQSGTTDFIPALEEAIRTAEAKERTWDFSEIPEWVKVASGHYYTLLRLQDYSSERKFIPRPEVELAKTQLPLFAAGYLRMRRRLKRAMISVP